MLIKLLKLIVNTFFRRVVVKGAENLPASGPMIITPNHPNALIDPLLMFFLSPAYRVRFVAKAPLFNIPLLGRLMRAMGAIPVVRRHEARGKVDYRGFFDSCLESLSAGDVIVIFPEGVSLPQPHMASLRTGPGRLFFLAGEKDLRVPILPVGINYEQPSIFRTDVVISVGVPIDASDLTQAHAESPKAAVRQLTERIGSALNELVFQTDNFRDRELMLLLEHIYANDNADRAWPERVGRLKAIAAGLNALQGTRPAEIDHLRQLLEKYARLASMIENTQQSPAPKAPGRVNRLGKALAGFPLAALGWLFAIVPYQMCGFLVTKVKKHDAAAAATYKIVYALVLYPLAFFVEGVLIYMTLGGAACLLFALLVIPLSYFTLFYFEWLNDIGWNMALPSRRLKRRLHRRAVKKLAAQRTLINDLVNGLAQQLQSYTANMNG
jgi:1-acyl-sn-glycerol-3-phosphate acyltransferase